MESSMIEEDFAMQKKLQQKYSLSRWPFESNLDSSTFEEDLDWSTFEEEVDTEYEDEMGEGLITTMVELSPYTEFKDTAKANLKAAAKRFREIENKHKLADGYLIHDVFSLFILRKAKFLVSGEGKKVPISHLKGKVVGLYFYTHKTDGLVFRELSYMYDVLREKGENFELVFIPKHRDFVDEVRMFISPLLNRMDILFENKFHKFFKGKPWLALPFKPPSELVIDKFHDWSEMLRDACEPAELVIIRPDEEEDIYIAHAYAMDIFREFGIDAYPFSKSRLTELVVERLKSLTLLDFARSCFGQSGLVLIDNCKIHLVDLYRLCQMGTKILLFLDPRRDKPVYNKVKEWYTKMKEKYDDFEMVRCCYDENEDYYDSFPWLELHPFYRGVKNWNWCRELSDIFKYTGMKVKMDQGVPMFLAFGRDGKFVTMTSLEKKLIYDDDNCRQTSPDFFNDVHLYGQVALNIAIEKRWRALHEDDGKVHYHDYNCLDIFG